MNIDAWVDAQFRDHEAQMRSRRYRLCSFSTASQAILDGDPLLDYDTGMTLCELTLPGMVHWLEPEL